MASMTWICNCGSSHSREVGTCDVCGQERPDFVPQTASTAAPAVTTPRTGTTTETDDRECPGCGRLNLATATQCLKCGDDLAAQTNSAPIHLVLPDGEAVPLSEGEVVLLGREADDPAIRRCLSRYDQVSRRHAEIVIEGTTARVRDLRSTNGTYVDERPVTGETQVPVGEGIRIRFGKELEMLLTSGGSR